MQIRTETNIEKIKIEEIISLYIENGWGDSYDPELVENYFKNSTYSVFAIDQESSNLIGFARVLSDNYHTTWIAEVVVSLACQRMGVGTMLISEIKTNFNHTSIYAETFSGKESFFVRNGIKDRKNMVVVSRRKHP
ncbi:GNAT family N-acetyltransferase [Spirochaeta isovalerica]|uniref:Putative N-acetyltransferase YhbS n=1 Tax=Spirochaeta isovalerica TaxID=150 RepID=A0A841RHS9_9SPIO|nr:GNAT family N-acetyltransferase [Spirochaeta isovalerica]MBB6482727.1 putative N-acetyltransferase YhbS [Spirochaeta isovalerica]